MTNAVLPWVVLVVGDPSTPGAATAAAARTLEEPQALLSRALSLSSLAKVACLIGASFAQRWLTVTRGLWQANLFSLLSGEAVLDGVAGCLAALQTREPKATVMLIPFNHCAVQEATWLVSAQGVLRLGAENGNTVYFLHDDPANDPRVALAKPLLCTSSVLVGSAKALLALCAGRAMTIVDLVVEKPAVDELAAGTDMSASDSAAVNVVHIRLVEEYASLQRGDVWHRRKASVNLHA